MDVGKVVTSLMGALLIILCLMAAVFYLIPLYQKIQLDEVCREYTYMVNVNEGLDGTLRDSLKTELLEIGLKDVVIECPAVGSLLRRERKAFVVTGVVEYKAVKGFIDIGTEEGNYEFKGWVYGKRIIN